jgi:tape measure domain-containing protein
MATGPRIQYEIAATATGAAEVEKLATELEKLDDAVDPALAQKAREAAAALRAIGQQQEAIDAFVRWKTATGEARAELDRAQAAAQKLAAEIAQAGEPTKAQAGQMQKLRDAVRDAKQELQQQTTSLDSARSGLTQLGIPLDGVATKQRELKKSTADVRQEVEALATTARGASGFTALVRDTDAARLQMEAAARSVDAYARSLGAAGPPTASQVSELAKLQQAAAQARAEFERLQAETVQQATALRQAGANTEQLTAQARELASAQRQAATAAQQFGTQSTAASAQAQRAHDGVRSGIDSIGSSLRTVQGLAAAAIGGDLLAGTVGDVIKTADAYDNLAARIKLVTGEGVAFDTAFQGVYEVAKRTSSALESTGTLFSRIATAGKELGLSQQQALQLTETINSAVQLSGASAQASDAAITQLIQGLQSGVLRGEEFNSVMEQAPRLASALADGLGVPIGKLREMAGEGKLTTAAVLQALQAQRAVIEREFGSLPATVGRAITNLQTEWSKFIGTTNASTGATATVAEGINLLAGNLQEVADVAGRAGSVLTAALAVQGVAALRAFVVEGRAATLVSTALSASLGSIPKVISITVAAAGFEVGFRIGEMLRENSVLARQLGVAVAGFLQATVSDLQLLAESASAIFTNDTIDAALTRYKQRAVQLDESFRVLWDEAEKGPTSAAAAMDQASGAAQVAGASAQGAAQAVGSIAPAAGAATGALANLGTQAAASLPVARDAAQQIADKLGEVGQKGGVAKDVFEKDIPGAIEKLDGAGLGQFFGGLSSALGKAQSDAQRFGEQMQSSGDAGSAGLAKSELAADRLQQAMGLVGNKAATALGVDLDSVGTRVTKSFTDADNNLNVLLRSLPLLKQQGVDTGAAVAQALGGMINRAKNEAEVDAVVSRINTLGQSGVLSGQQVAGAMQAAGDQATALRAKIEDATPGVNSLGEAARRAGVDFGALTTGVSQTFADGVVQVRDLANQIDATGTKASLAGPVLAQALNQRAAAAQTTEEARLLEAEISRIIGRSPELAGALSGALDQVKQKAAELTPEMKRLQADAGLLGIKLTQGTDSGAGGVTKVIESYERLKASGQVTAGEIDTAFQNMALKVMQSSGGVAPEWLKVEAGLRGVTLQADQTGGSLSGVGSSGQNAGNQIAEGLNNANGSGLTLLDTLRSVRERNAEVTAASAASDAARKSMNAQGVDATGVFRLREKLDSGTLTAADADLVKGVADAAKQNAAMSKGANPSALSQEFWRSLQEQTAIAQRAQEVLAGLGSMPAWGQGVNRIAQAPAPVIAPPTPTPAPAPVAQSSRTVVVNLALPGGGTRTETIQASDQQSADALLRVLESSARAMGR